MTDKVDNELVVKTTKEFYSDVKTAMAKAFPVLTDQANAGVVGSITLLLSVLQDVILDSKDIIKQGLSHADHSDCTHHHNVGGIMDEVDRVIEKGLRNG